MAPLSLLSERAPFELVLHVARRLRKNMQPAIVIVLLMLTISSLSGEWAIADCGPTPLGQREGWWGFTIAATEDESTVSFLPQPSNRTISPVKDDPGLFYTFEGILEELSRRAEILPVFVSLPPICSAVDAPTSWTDDSALGVLEKVLKDCDLTVAVDENFGIVANREMIQRTAVLVSIGPIAGEALPTNAEEALYRDLYLHAFPLRYTYPSHSLYAVSIGYLPVPGYPNEYIVFAGTYHEISGDQYRVFRARISGGNDPSVECLWGEWSGGPPFQSFNEDLDGDGSQDILIDRRSQRISIRDEMVPSSVVSANTGEELFSFVREEIAIQRPQGGPTQVSAMTKDAYVSGDPCLPIFEFSSATGDFKKVTLIPDPSPESPSCTDPAERLTTTWDGPATIVVYDLLQPETDCRANPDHSQQARQTSRREGPWAFSRYPLRIQGTEIAIDQPLASRTMLKYIPSEYSEAVMETR